MAVTRNTAYYALDEATANGACGGPGVGSTYFLLNPPDTNPKNNFPASPAFAINGYHVQNVALPNWYVGAAPKPTVAAAPAGRPSGHQLIGYWAGYGSAGSTFPSREVSPQWDVILVAFAIPDQKAPGDDAVSQAMTYLITGRAPAGSRYRLRQPGGYPGILGAMFWTIDADRRANYQYSNQVGPLLHSDPSR